MTWQGSNTVECSWIGAEGDRIPAVVDQSCDMQQPADLAERIVRCSINKGQCQWQHSGP